MLNITQQNITYYAYPCFCYCGVVVEEVLPAKTDIMLTKKHRKSAVSTGLGARNDAPGRNRELEDRCGVQDLCRRVSVASEGWGHRLLRSGDLPALLRNGRADRRLSPLRGFVGKTQRLCLVGRLVRRSVCRFFAWFVVGGGLQSFFVPCLCPTWPLPPSPVA
jgi:hypothetical protein